MEKDNTQKTKRNKTTVTGDSNKKYPQHDACPPVHKSYCITVNTLAPECAIGPLNLALLHLGIYNNYYCMTATFKLPINLMAMSVKSPVICGHESLVNYFKGPSTNSTLSHLFS